MTPEEILESVSAAYDSIHVIDELNLHTEVTEEDTQIINRNIEHLKIMMSKQWFVDALITEQKDKINSYII